MFVLIIDYSLLNVAGVTGPKEHIDNPCELKTVPVPTLTSEYWRRPDSPPLSTSNLLSLRLERLFPYICPVFLLRKARHHGVCSVLAYSHRPESLIVIPNAR